MILRATATALHWFAIGLILFGIGFELGYRQVQMVGRIASENGIDPSLAYKMVEAESRGLPFAVGRGGERGLFQITEETWGALTSDPYWMAFSPQRNTEVAMQNLLDARTSDPKCLISYHNAGTTRWERLNKKWSVNHPNKVYRAIYRSE